MIAGIFGAGFGLYGHLPALLSFGVEKVVLPECYEAVISKREELRPFLGSVEFMAHEVDLLNRADLLVLARHPAGNRRVLVNLERFKNDVAIIVEKPLGRQPKDALDIVNQLSSKRWRLSLPFQHTHWFHELREIVNDSHHRRLEIAIVWSFDARNIKRETGNWKSNPKEGGGVVGFYGIHLLGVAAGLGFRFTSRSDLQTYDRPDLGIWKASFSSGHTTLFVELNSAASSAHFAITVKNIDTGEEAYSHTSRSPFGYAHLPGQIMPTGMGDGRVPFLIPLYKDLLESPVMRDPIAVPVTNLWGGALDRSGR